jgi:hypothetical protein
MSPFSLCLPFIVGLLPLTVTGHAGVSHMPSLGAPPFEAKHIVALTSFAAILMGTTLTVRDLVGERTVFRREQAAGLSASAYLLAKTIVFSAVAVVQSAILVLIVTAPAIGKPGPSHAVVLGSPIFELFVGVAATCVAAVVLGLAVSAVARTGDQVIVLLAMTLMAQLVLAGGFIPVTDRPLMEALAWLTPGRWGFAANASTADLTNLVAGIANASHLAAHHVGVAREHGHVGCACRALRRRHAVAPQTLMRSIVTRNRCTPAGRRAEAQSGCGAAPGSTTSR